MCDTNVAIQASNQPLPVIDLSKDALFKQPTQREDCKDFLLENLNRRVCNNTVPYLCLLTLPSLGPICFLALPLENAQQTIYHECCGKVICLGCEVASKGAGLEEKCPFCRAPFLRSSEENIIRLQKRVDANDPEGMIMLGAYYQTGSCGLKQDEKKSSDLLMRAADLGLCTAHFSLAIPFSECVYL